MLAVEMMKAQYLKRKAKNPLYSIRSFARDLEVSHAFISLVFSGKSKIGPKQAAKISTRLDLSTREQKRFVHSILYTDETQDVPNNAYRDLQIDFENVVSRWHHVALLELTYIKGFKNDPVWIAKKLGISSIEVRDAIQRLKTLELLEEKNGTLQALDGILRIRTSTSKSAVRTYYKTMMEKATHELTRTSDEAFHSRYIGGGTLAIQADKIEPAIRRLKEMQDEFIQEFASKDSDDVYQIGLQFCSVLEKGEIK